MKATMTAINPPHTTNIFDGKKIIEWRTFKMPLGWHFIYETLKKGGCGKVIGHFIVAFHQEFRYVSEIPEYIIEAGCVSREFLYEYAKARPLYANYIITPKRFKEPLPHTVFKRYVEPKKSKRRRTQPSFTMSRKLQLMPLVEQYQYGKWGKPYRIVPKDAPPPQSYLYIEIDEDQKFEY